jgi:tetratricopeptide (TPR) repeat protein
MQVASVIGREFAFRILQAISGMREEVKADLLDLQRLEIIYEKSLFPEIAYIFKHALIQEVAYNSLLLKKRREIHENIGKAIEDLYSERLEEFYEMLAWHYSHGKNQDKACQFLKLSGQKAIRSNSHREAFRLFKEALEVLHQMPRTTTNNQHRLEILRLMAVSMWPLGYPENSIDFLREGESLAKESGDDNALATFLGYIGHYYVVAGGDPTLGMTYAEKALSASELIGEVEIIAPVVFDLTTSYGVTGSHWKICEVAPKCIKLIERTGKQSETFGKPFEICSVLKAQYGAAMAAMGDFDVGERILRDSRECTHQISKAFIEVYHTAFYLFKGDGNKAASHAKAAAELSEKNQLVYLAGFMWACVGQGYLILGQAKEALEHLEKGLGIQLGVGIPLYLGWTHAGLGLAHLQLGNMDKALVHAEQGVKLSRANNERHTEALSEIYLGMILGAGRSAPFDEASEHILRGINKADELKIKPWATVGRFYLGKLNAYSGRTAEATEHLRKAEPVFREMGMDYWLDRTRKLLEIVRI